MKNDQIAEICHETNRAYCALLGDDSQLAWADAPEWQRASALRGVESIRNGSISGARASHDSWMVEKLRAGWRWGPEKDAAAKMHPCLLPYASLPAEQRAKDHLFVAVALAMIESGKRPA